MAKTAGNSKGAAGKDKAVGKQPVGKQPVGKKAVAKTTDAKPARAKSSQRSKAAARSARAVDKKGGMRKFLHDVRVEMGKVTWPTRKDLAQSTVVVLVAVAIAAVYTAVLDFGFSKSIDFVIGFLT